MKFFKCSNSGTGANMQTNTVEEQLMVMKLASD
jgi:hypothetical protein